MNDSEEPKGTPVLDRVLVVILTVVLMVVFASVLFLGGK